MKFETPEIDPAQLLAALRQRYPGMLGGADTIQFCPLGEDAWCYKVSSDSVASCFVRVEAETDSIATLERLEAAGAMTEQLRTLCGMHDVVAPLRDCNGSLASVLPPRFVLQVFPYVIGQQAMGEDGAVRDDDRLAAIRFVARLHYCGRQLQRPPSPGEMDWSMPKEQFSHGHAPAVQRAIAHAVSSQPLPANDDASESQTRWQVATCRALLADASGIEWLLRTLNEMEEELRTNPDRYDVVLTHSECHLANFMRSDSDGQLYCVDWGDLALGPRERDLALLCCDDLAPAAVCAYVDELKRMHQSHGAEQRTKGVSSGTQDLSIQLNPTAYAYYHYKWAVQEIADWCTRILFWDISEEEQGRCFDELKDYLPVRREDLHNCLNGEAAEDELLRLLAKALRS